MEALVMVIVNLNGYNRRTQWPIRTNRRTHGKPVELFIPITTVQLWLITGEPNGNRSHSNLEDLQSLRWFGRSTTTPSGESWVTIASVHHPWPNHRNFSINVIPRHHIVLDRDVALCYLRDGLVARNNGANEFWGYPTAGCAPGFVKPWTPELSGSSSLTPVTNHGECYHSIWDSSPLWKFPVTIHAAAHRSIGNIHRSYQFYIYTTYIQLFEL